MYMRGQPDYLEEDWLAKSVPIRMESVISGQCIREQKAVSFFNLLNNFNVGFTLSAIFLLSLVGIFSCSFLINEITKRIRFERRRTVKICKRIATATSSFRVKRLSAIGIFVLFVHLFLWVSQLFLINNIKTNKVVSSKTFNLKQTKNSKNFSILFRWSTHRNWSRTSRTSSAPPKLPVC